MIGSLPPLQVRIMDLDLLAALLPGGHLNGLVLVIGFFVSILDDINMYPLCLLRIIVVSGPKKAD